jgi:hypothetical protein
VKGSFGGITGFIKNSKLKRTKTNKDLVKRVLLGVPAYTLHRKAITKFPRRKIFIPCIDDQWICDLLDIRKYSKYNQGYKFLFTCIDGFSRYAWVEPLKNKSAEVVLDGFKNISKRANPRKCRIIQFDKGKEFLNSKFLDYLKSSNIEHFCVESELKASLIEIFNKTLFTKIARYMTHKKSKMFINILQDFVKNYNNSFHRIIKCTPASVTKETEGDVYMNQYGNIKMKATSEPIFKIGDKVLISKIRGHFEKGYGTHFSPEIFYVDRIGSSEPRMYYLRDQQGEKVLGGFYKQQMLQVSHE